MTTYRALIGLFVTGGTGGMTYLSWQYANFLIERFGLALVIGPGMWVGLNVALIVVLEKDERPWRRAIGEAWSAAFFYTALLQAIVFLVIIFMAVAVVLESKPLPDSSALAQDVLVGAGYLSCFVFGGTGLYCVAMSDRVSARALGGVLSLITIGLPLYVLLLHEEALTTFHESHPAAFVWLGISYLAVFSAVTMHAYRLSLGRVKL